ncbi:MAG: TetR/AcrR family transcriptional regulator [Desulfobacterales bacterium]|nr:TetR/AcrR family transcriptional regulator [Desulfobacterales bacterium]
MGVKERREKEKELRRQTILEAAKGLFFEQGFAATTMNQIAEAAELGKGTLYLYFRNKEELYISLLVEGMALLNTIFEETISDLTGWEKKFMALGWAYYQYSVDYSEFFQISFQFQHGELTANISDELYQKCFQEGLKSLNALSGILEEGMASGDIEKQDPMELTVVLWGSLTGLILLHMAKDHRKFMPVPLETLVGNLLSLNIKALQK